MARRPAASSSELKYVGPNSGFTDDDRDIQLIKGRTYADLPADHPIIVSLIDRKLLLPAAATTAPTPVEPEL